MCCTSNFNNGGYPELVGYKYSNLTTSQAEQECLTEWETNPTAYNGNMQTCVAAKKQGSGQQVAGYLTQAGGILNNLGGMMAVLFGGQMANAQNQQLPPVSNEPQGLSAGAWVGIGAGALALITLVYFVTKDGGKKNG